jgi:hypothetical protein
MLSKDLNGDNPPGRGAPSQRWAVAVHLATANSAGDAVYARDTRVTVKVFEVGFVGPGGLTVHEYVQNLGPRAADERADQAWTRDGTAG